MLIKIPVNHESNKISLQNLNKFGKIDHFKHVKETRYSEITMDIKGIPMDIKTKWRCIKMQKNSMGGNGKPNCACRVVNLYHACSPIIKGTFEHGLCVRRMVTGFVFVAHVYK
jgi:hypothetical protein